MDLEDLFDNDHKKRKHSYRYGQENHDNYHGHHDYSHSEKHDFDTNVLLSKLKSNPKLIKLVIIGAVILVIIVLVMIVLFFPVLLKLVDYLTQNGLKGLIDTVWEGTK